MKPEIKAKWLAALRSGEYVQGRDCLRSTRPDDASDSFCCLGVLCDLAAREGVVEWDGTDDGETEYGIQYHTLALPLPVMVWAGLAEDNPRVACNVGGYTSASVASLNDEHGFTFGEIADCIEVSL